MKFEDIPRPWLLAAVTGVPMATLLRRAEQEDVEPPAALLHSLLCDEEKRASDRDPARCHRVIYWPPWQ